MKAAIHDLKKALRLVIEADVPPCDEDNQSQAIRFIERLVDTQEEMETFKAARSN